MVVAAMIPGSSVARRPRLLPCVKFFSVFEPVPKRMSRRGRPGSPAPVRGEPRFLRRSQVRWRSEPNEAERVSPSKAAT